MGSTDTTPNYPPRLPLWHEPAPHHSDLRVSWWLKLLFVATCAALAMWLFDQPIALYMRHNPIPDFAYSGKHPEGVSDPNIHGDIARETMFLEQFGQFSCTVLAIASVVLLDPKGRRRALSIAIACILTVLLSHLLKYLCGRSRPFSFGVPISAQGLWEWGGEGDSFPSAHTTAAFALAASLSWYYPRGRKLFMGLAITTATFRVLHFAHFLSDVIAGMGIGVLVARASLRAKVAGSLIAMSIPRARRWWLADT